MGQRADVDSVGGGTVRMGRRDLESMGGLRFGFGDRPSFSFSFSLRGCGPEAGKSVDDEVRFPGPSRDCPCTTSRPDTMGGGNSRPSAALRESWRAKSEACHHSRNLRAKMEAGRRILRLDSKRG